MKLSVFLSLMVVCLWVSPCLTQAIKRKVPPKGQAQHIIWDLKNCDKIRSGLEKHLFMHLNGTFTQLRIRDAFPVLMRLLLPLNCTRSAPDPPAQDPPVSTADGEPAPVPVDEELPAYDSRPKRQVFMGPWMFGMSPFMNPLPLVKELGELFPLPQSRTPIKDVIDRPGGMLSLFNPLLGMMTTESSNTNNNLEGNAWPRTLGMMSMAQMMGLAGQQQRQLLQQQQRQHLQQQQLQRQLQQQQQQQQQQLPQLKSLQQAGQFRKKRAINSEATVGLSLAPIPLEPQRPSFDTPKESSPFIFCKGFKHLFNPFLDLLRTVFNASHGDGQLPPAFRWPGMNHHHEAAFLDGETPSPAVPPQTLQAAAPLSKSWAVTARGLVPAEDPAVLASDSNSGGISGRWLLPPPPPSPGTAAWPFSALPWASGEKATVKARVRRASEESSSDKYLTEIVQLGDLTFPADTFVKAVELGLFSDVEKSKSE